MRNGLYRFAPQAALALPASAQDAPNNSDLTVAQPVVAYHATVVSQEAAASRVGVDILKRGGDAVDAAVAVGFALAVTLPRAGNIGGFGREASGSANTIWRSPKRALTGASDPRQRDTLAIGY
jgi:gamma-glutamyltranspeptidase